MRQRPCLPLKSNTEPLSAEHLATGCQVPLYSCPWARCVFLPNDRTLFLRHVAGGAADRTREHELRSICKSDIKWMSCLDCVQGAVALAERERWPCLGLSVTCRSLNLLCKRFNDKTVKCLTCSMCAQLRTTCGRFSTCRSGICRFMQ